MILKWLRQRRRRKILRTAYPEAWDRIITDNVKYVQHLSPAQQRQLRQHIQIFVQEKYWEGCGGFVITEEVKVTIAAQACLLLLNMPDECYDNVLSILVYPDEYLVRESDASFNGVVSERGELRLGEAVWRGPVILSWPDVLAGGRSESHGGHGEQEGYGDNLVLHEFAHQIDMLNGRFADGIPPLNSQSELDLWLQVMQPEYQRHVANCEAGQHGVIDCYGAINAAEFFAVVIETFFEQPIPLRSQHAAVYDLLKSYFRIDPATWYA